MIKAGALDSLGNNRASLMAGVPEALKIADQARRDQTAGQDDLFGEVITAETVEAVIPDQPEWDEEFRLASEKETLGLYLTGHPITRYQEELRAITSQRLGDLEMDASDADKGYRAKRKEVTVAGLIIGIRVRTNNDGRKWAVVTLDDKTGRVDILMFADSYETWQHLLVADRVLIVRGGLSFDERNNGFSIRAQECFDIDQARAQFARRLVLSISPEQTQNGLVQKLQKTLSPHLEGRCNVYIKYQGADAEAVVKMGDAWKIQPSDELMHRLGDVLGKERVLLRYD
jgi:DNA polymerase-3 subunit alpha